MKSKVLITGADGFIGSHLVELLLKEGFSIKAFCLYNSQGSWGWIDTLSDEIKSNIEVYLGDIRDREDPKDLTDLKDLRDLAGQQQTPY